MARAGFGALVRRAASGVRSSFRGRVEFGASSEGGERSFRSYFGGLRVEFGGWRAEFGPSWEGGERGVPSEGGNGSWEVLHRGLRRVERGSEGWRAEFRAKVASEGGEWSSNGGRRECREWSVRSTEGREKPRAARRESEWRVQWSSELVSLRFHIALKQPSKA